MLRLRTNLLALALLAAPSVPAVADNLMGMAAIKALISGNTVYMQNLENKLFLRMHYEPSGQFAVLRDDGARYDGLWSVRADGTYTRFVGGAAAFNWLTISPGKDF
jgi:hypothetical protein